MIQEAANSLQNFVKFWAYTCILPINWEGRFVALEGFKSNIIPTLCQIRLIHNSVTLLLHAIRVKSLGLFGVHLIHFILVLMYVTYSRLFPPTKVANLLNQQTNVDRYLSGRYTKRVFIPFHSSKVQQAVKLRADCFRCFPPFLALQR